MSIKKKSNNFFYSYNFRILIIMWHGKRKSSNLVEHGRELLKTNPLYSEDFIMENGIRLTLRTYKLDSTIKISGFDENYKVLAGDVLY